MRLPVPSPPCRALTSHPLVPLITQRAGCPRSLLRPERPSEQEAEASGREGRGTRADQSRSSSGEGWTNQRPRQAGSRLLQAKPPKERESAAPCYEGLRRVTKKGRGDNMTSPKGRGHLGAGLGNGLEAFRACVRDQPARALAQQLSLLPGWALGCSFWRNGAP